MTTEATEEEAEEAEGRCRAKNQEPHTEMWGKSKNRFISRID